MRLLLLLFMICSAFSSCANSIKDNGYIIITGKVEGIPANKIYIKSIFSPLRGVVLDSATYQKNEFTFKYKMPVGLDILTVSLFFYDPSGKLHILAYTNSYSKPPNIQTAFVLEKGTTTITGKVTDLDNLGTNPLEISTRGNETMLFYKYYIGFGSMAGTDSSNKQQRIAYYRNIIKQYPRSYFLLGRIANQSYQYTNEQLQSITEPFDKTMLVSKSMLAIQEYMATRPQKGKPVNINIPSQDANGRLQLAIDTSQPLNMVIFWASWCMPCRQEIPMLKNIYQQYQSKGLHMASISIDEKEPLWKKAMDVEKMPWQQLWADSTGYLAWQKAVDLLALPTVYFIDKKGVVVGTVIGNDASNADKFRAIINKHIL